MTYIVTLARPILGTLKVSIEAPDSDVAVFRAKRRGLPALWAHPKR